MRCVVRNEGGKGTARVKATALLGRRRRIIIQGIFIFSDIENIEKLFPLLCFAYLIL